MSLRDWLLESGSTNLKPTKPEPAAAPPAATDRPQFSVVSSDSGSNDFYTSMLKVTDFFTTEAGQKVKKYYDALAVLTDESLRLKTALGQAKQLDGLTDSQVLTAFDEIAQTLSTEQLKFKGASEEFEANEVLAKQKHIEDLRTQLGQLQQELSDTTMKAAENQTVLSTQKSKFESAFNRRSSELQNEKTKYSAILKG